MTDPTPTTSVSDRLDGLHESIDAQGRRVFDVVLQAVESYFDADVEKAGAVILADDEIDRIDVEIERACIGALRQRLDGEHEIRTVLTIVKVNNELERIADLAVTVAEAVVAGESTGPATFRVMANSVIGMLRDSIRALADGNADLARQVLRFDDTVDEFKGQILADARDGVAEQRVEIGVAFRLLAVTKAVERIADHCTNICEQVIYLQSGKIVRHRPEGWTEPESPA